MADYSMYRGDTWELDGTVTAAAGGAQNLTGCKLWFTAKRSRSDADVSAVFQLSSPSGGIAIVSAAAGTFRITVSPPHTSGLTAKAVLYYDLQLEDASGNVYTLDSGTLTVNLDVTVTTD